MPTMMQSCAQRRRLKNGCERREHLNFDMHFQSMFYVFMGTSSYSDIAELAHESGTAKASCMLAAMLGKGWLAIWVVMVLMFLLKRMNTTGTTSLSSPSPMQIP
eukprot:gnl/TRDRNA2_/TRDRNA2_88756_c0_seq1.p2 gnl/TRDRNA2_/TRDRNA2_88756_c0~~gnl/TRDRNA2_/TRDRNA2_88756_c0_seq1.p2  ORF type:complete len:104 (-),score=4.31 gnl/TRDRNA2_/TRDRNA2_88756_c0_seq1:99-410(-)